MLMSLLLTTSLSANQLVPAVRSGSTLPEQGTLIARLDTSGLYVSETTGLKGGDAGAGIQLLKMCFQYW